MAIDDNLICKRVDYLDKQIEQLNVITEWYPDYAYIIEKNVFQQVGYNLQMLLKL